MSSDRKFEMPDEARARIAGDRVVWLTTVTDRGAPAPNPVWFLPDGDDLVIFTAPGSRKVHNIERRPAVCVHFNSDPHGGDVVIINGEAELTHAQKPSGFPGFLEKYEADITGALATTVEAIDETYDTMVRVRPSAVRLTPA
jgi:PPOX class probable F420-dependent enzyme